MTTIPAHTDALCAFLARWTMCQPGPKSDAWAREIAAALCAIVADGYSVIDSLGGLYLVRPAPDQPRIPPRLRRIAELFAPLPPDDAPAEPLVTTTPATSPALAAEGPLTANELTALSRLGWEVAATEAGRVRMNYVHDEAWTDETRTPGGWRALL